MSYILTSVRFLTLTLHFEKEGKEMWAKQKYSKGQAVQTWTENHSLSKWKDGPSEVPEGWFNILIGA